MPAAKGSARTPLGPKVVQWPLAGQYKKMNTTPYTANARTQNLGHLAKNDPNFQDTPEKYTFPINLATIA